jgi:hypothetical protein
VRFGLPETRLTLSDLVLTFWGGQAGCRSPILARRFWNLATTGQAFRHFQVGAPVARELLKRPSCNRLISSVTTRDVGSPRARSQRLHC